MTGRLAGGTVILLVSAASVTAAELKPEAIAAWNGYVAAAAAQRDRGCGADTVMSCPIGAPEGVVTDVPGGTIHHWRGSTVVRGTTVEQVVRALMYPGTAPPQEDVLESRVLRRSGNSLHTYLKVARSAIITVVYDTEHDVTFERISTGMARSRSVSTRIAEVGGGDRGFLWRLNSYWRYTQVGPDVRIDLESLSLSRDIPRLVRAVAGPISNRIARESIVRTLASLRAFLESGRGPE